MLFIRCVHNFDHQGSKSPQAQKKKTLRPALLVKENHTLLEKLTSEPPYSQQRHPVKASGLRWCLGWTGCFRPGMGQAEFAHWPSTCRWHYGCDQGTSFKRPPKQRVTEGRTCISATAEVASVWLKALEGGSLKSKRPPSSHGIYTFTACDW